MKVIVKRFFLIMICVAAGGYALLTVLFGFSNVSFEVKSKEACSRCLYPGASRHKSGVLYVAFYFPQFHITPENKWPGTGSYWTDWDHVRDAKGDKSLTPLSMYNLATPEVLEKQDALADKFGVGVFAFYHYFYNGKMVMNLPLDLFIQKSRKTKMVLVWDNQPSVMGQLNYSAASACDHGYQLLRFFLSENYLMSRDKEVPFLVYCASKEVQEYLIALKAFLKNFNIRMRLIAISQRHTGSEPKTYSWYDGVAAFEPNMRRHGYPFDRTYPPLVDPNEFSEYWNGVAIGWDSRPRQLSPYSRHKKGNTPQRDGYVNIDAFKKIIDKQKKEIFRNNPDKIITLFAWNEWSEGGVLECSKEYECAFLEAL